MKKVRIGDVAERAGVSKATVSLVLNNKESGIRISEKTRLKVLQAAKDLNYSPNYGARLLSTGKSCVVGVLAVNENSLFVSDYDTRVMEGISTVVHESGYHILVMDAGIVSHKKVSLGHALYSGFLDGMIIVGPDFVSEEMAQMIREIHRNGVPFVYAWRKSGDIDASVICIDNVQAARMGVEYLISLGHRRIGYVSFGDESLSGKERLQGYREALAKHDIPFDETLVWEDVRMFLPNKIVNEENLFRVLKQPNPPTALFVPFDPLAIGILNSLQKRGISVPEDLSILGFGDIMMASFSSPQLTTIREPLQEIGRHAAQTLVEQIENGKKEQKTIEKVLLSVELVVRESCRAVK